MVYNRIAWASLIAMIWLAIGGYIQMTWWNGLFMLFFAVTALMTAIINRAEKEGKDETSD